MGTGRGAATRGAAAAGKAGVTLLRPTAPAAWAAPPNGLPRPEAGEAVAGCGGGSAAAAGPSKGFPRAADTAAVGEPSNGLPSDAGPGGPAAKAALPPLALPTALLLTCTLCGPTAPLLTCAL